jgi:hypothetical protein
MRKQKAESRKQKWAQTCAMDAISAFCFPSSAFISAFCFLLSAFKAAPDA